ncbi:hypothetical protein [Treponema pectinovorum]|uniref:hypothetical protein n=1 Tax=Treponema pectinovorum TaxID=164 RepID=UPI0011CA5F31|nr:hypothetical protein [Treponema pectinovorum]
MAIQPIDLSTIYSQMNNVAKNVAHQQQGAQLTQALQESNFIRQNAEMASQVHKTAEGEAKSAKIKGDGSGGEKSFSQENKKKDNEDTQENKKLTEIKESYLGQNIDILG